MMDVADEVLSRGGGLDRDAAKQLLSRVDTAYTRRFDPRVIHEHLARILKLSADEPVQTLVDRDERGRVQCTVIAFDHAFEFSLITGVLAGTGFSIDRGEVFTLKAPTAAGGGLGRATCDRGSFRWRRTRWNASASAGHDPRAQAVIIDHFVGKLEPHVDYDVWRQAVQEHLVEVLSLLNRRDEKSIEHAKRKVNQLVTRRLADLAAGPRVAAPPPYLAPVDIEILPVDGDQTRLSIVGADTDAFLYSLSTALSLQGLSIERVRIGGDDKGVEDVIHVVNAQGQPIRDAHVLQRIRLATVLTKQFTYFLGRAPDPFKALERFERLVEEIVRHAQAGKWLDLLKHPRVMEDLAKLLGASDFLWEEFIRDQYDVLLSIFQPDVERRRLCPPSETLPLRMREALEGAVGLPQQCDRLNHLKDREIFLIDLDHILVPGSDFRQLSERLTRVAETLVANAARCVYEDLVRSHGQPLGKDGRAARYAVFGLGKLGGVALGYASDIELMFLYSGEGRTTGGKRRAMTCGEFFEMLARDTKKFIRTKHEGIFEVDLRLRPYGQEGPLASSLDQFVAYYGPGGSAHSFEKLALVRLRWIAGDASFGYEVERDRDRFVYDHAELDLDALWEVWNRQHAQKAQPGRLNAKYSPGALVDLESAVMLLQVMHAGQAPQLRAPRLSVVITSLSRAGVLEPREYAELFGAYNFLRRLINALRMLRGSARDLFLPDRDADEYTHLAKRMGYEASARHGPAEQLEADFARRTGMVRDFIERHFGRPCPGQRVPG